MQNGALRKVAELSADTRRLLERIDKTAQRVTPDTGFSFA